MEQDRNDWRETDLVKTHLERSSRYVADECVTRYQRYVSDFRLNPRFDNRRQWFQSPLEAVFLLWWEAVILASGRNDFYLQHQEETHCDTDVYRLDFTVELMRHGLWDSLNATGKSWPMIGVELDGHSFHEKTRDQVTYRNKRDRALQQAGWKVFHYSFDEMTRQPEKCIRDVIAFSYKQYDSLSVELSNRSR